MVIIFYFKLDAVIILHIQHFINKIDVDFSMNQIEKDSTWFFHCAASLPFMNLMNQK
jgi:hypothetical protein